MRGLLVAIIGALACDTVAPPVSFREDAAVVVHLDDLDSLEKALAQCDGGGHDVLVALSAAGPDLPEGQPLTLQADVLASSEFVVCLGKTLEEMAVP